MVCRIGAGSAKPGGLDHDALKIGDFAFCPVLEEGFQSIHQIAAHGAAKAAAVEQHNFLVRFHDERIVQSDFAELVYDHSDPF